MNRRIQGLVLTAGWASVSLALSAAGEGVELTLPSAPGGPVNAKVVAPKGTDGVVLFYRIEGQTDFQSVNLQARLGGTFEGELREAFPPGARLQDLRGSADDDGHPAPAEGRPPAAQHAPAAGYGRGSRLAI